MPPTQSQVRRLSPRPSPASLALEVAFQRLPARGVSAGQGFGPHPPPWFLRPLPSLPHSLGSGSFLSPGIRTRTSLHLHISTPPAAFPIPPCHFPLLLPSPVLLCSLSLLRAGTSGVPVWLKSRGCLLPESGAQAWGFLDLFSSADFGQPPERGARVTAPWGRRLSGVPPRSD